MDKKKSLTKAGSSAKNTQVPARKTAKKIPSAKSGKKGEVKVKATVSGTKTASGRKTSPVTAKAAATKSSRETKKLSKASGDKKASGKKPVRPINISKSVSPGEKEVKKAPGTVAASKTKPSPEKTVKAMKPIKTATRTEASSKKEEKIAAIESNAKPKKKSAVKEAPVLIKEARRGRPKPIEKPGTPLAASRKGVKKKAVAAYALPPRREIKSKRSFDLRVFLPEEELPEEEPQILPPSELPEEYGENELLLLEVDPSRVFASWEIKPEDIVGEAGRLILRVYDVTGVDSEKVQGRRFFDIPISRRVASKFFDIKMPGRDVIMEIGLLYPEGSFRAIMRSHRVSMPELQIFEELGITGLLSDSDALIGY